MRRGSATLTLAILLLALRPGASAAEEARPELPLSDGVVLQDGTVVAGAVEELDDGRFRTTEEGEATVLERRRVAVALREGKVVHRDREAPVHRAWRRQLAPEVVSSCEALSKLYVRARLYTDALDVMESAVEWGLPETRLEALRKKLAKRKERVHPERKREAMAPEIAQARAPLIRKFRDAARWCSEKGLLRAASALLGEAMRLTTDTEEILAQTASLIPPGFPWREEPEAARLWLRWAGILPVESSWVPSEGPIRAALTDPPWNRPDTLVIRSRNVLLLSRVDDPEIVATCLRNGEAAVQAVEDLLGYRHRSREGARWDFLEVRLFATREEYEKAASKKGQGRGAALPPSSAGCFSPSRKLSLFFVPEPTGERSIRESLSESVAHVLTHHYLDVRWRIAERRGHYSVTTPGFWCVEGIAGFVADQVSGNRGDGRLDDVETRSLRVAAAAARKEVLLPLSRLLALSQWELQSISKVPFFGVEGSSDRLGQLDLFHVQATALTFFLVHRRGLEGRKQYADYLLDFYRGSIPPEGWKTLGYPGKEGLVRDFEKFLDTVP